MFSSETNSEKQRLKPEKNSGLNRIRTHGLCNTGAVLYQLPDGLLAQLVEHCTTRSRRLLRGQAPLPWFRLHIFSVTQSDFESGLVTPRVDL